MGIATAIAAASVAIGAIGTAVSYSEQQKSNKLQKQAIQVQQRQADIEAGRSRRQIYRDMMKAQSQSEVSAAAQGGLASSSLAGGISQAANSAMQSGRDTNQNLDTTTQLNQLKSQSIGLGQTGQLISGISRGLGSLSGVFSGPKIPSATATG